MTPTALFLSPHLDDVAFSCGGTLRRLATEGWRVELVTAFAASVPDPQGFALACQLDKRIPAEADYMAMRRAEDLRFAAMAGAEECVHLEFREAPHRGYESAAELFAGVREGDAIWMPLAEELRERAQRADCIFVPQGLGNHVDHLQVIRAVHEAGVKNRVFWYRDTPYAILQPRAIPAALVLRAPKHVLMEIDVAQKAAACALYETQVPFQFGSAAAMREQLERFHCTGGSYAENFLCSTEAKTSPLQSRTMTRGI